MKKNVQTDDRAGFSLIEVLVVLVVIAILSAMVIVALQNAFDRAKQRGTMADMRTIGKTIQTYYSDYGAYPPNGLTMAQLAPFLIPLQSSVVPVEDHWKHAYVYSTDGSGYTVECFGKDGVDGLEIDYSTRFDFDRDMILSNGMFVASPES